MNLLAGFGRFVLFVATFVRASVRRRPLLAETLEQAYSIGVFSLPILMIVSAFVGTNLALQGYTAFRPIGADRLLGMFVALAGSRELAPIMAASMVAAKAGTEMASQIAVMRIQEQIDALEVMAINPYWYLISPRILAIWMVLPALTVMCIFVMLMAAWAVATFQIGVNGDQFWAVAMASTPISDLFFGMFKALIFGTVICLVSCYYGFHSRPGPAGVGQATNAAVVVSAVVCMGINYLISEALYGGIY